MSETVFLILSLHIINVIHKGHLWLKRVYDLELNVICFVVKEIMNDMEIRWKFIGLLAKMLCH